MTPADITAFMELHFEGAFDCDTLREAREALRDKGLPVKHARMVRDFHPFAVPGKCRKGIVDAPEWLTPSDWAIAASMAQCETPEALQALAFSSPATTRAVFWRILGWPEGMVYCHPLRDPAPLDMTRELLESKTWRILANQLPHAKPVAPATPN